MKYSELVESIVNNANTNTINFIEPFYLSGDLKTILGEVTLKEILFLNYRYTDAGSNPREYYGLTNANKEIFKSLFRESYNLFSYLHSGVIITMNSDNPPRKGDSKIIYSDCCLTNGNQTRYIILLITLLKLFFLKKEIGLIHRKEVKEFKETLKGIFQGSIEIVDFLDNIEAKRVNEIINFLLENGKYLTRFKELDLNTFLSFRIRAQVNFLNSIIKDIDKTLTESETGTLIAEANNATRVVPKQDLFGNKYQSQLEKHIFKDFLSDYPEKTIEYRAGELPSENSNKIHLLVLLRPIIATGLLTKEKDIFSLTNKRDSTYKILGEFMKRLDSKRDLASIISKLISLLYRIKINFIIPLLEENKDVFVREYKKKAYAGDIAFGVFENDFNNANNDKEKERVIKNLVKFNPDHIMAVIVFTIRNLICENNNKDISLGIKASQEKEFYKTLVTEIYRQYVESRLREQYFSSYVRTKEYFEIGSAVYTALINMYKVEESDFIESNRYPISS